MTLIPHQHDISDLPTSKLNCALKLVRGHIERVDERVFWVADGGCPFCY